MMTIFTMILLRDSLRGKAGPWNKFGSRCIQADFESAGNRVLAARIQQSVSYTFPGLAQVLARRQPYSTHVKRHSLLHS